ncbi:hypothetical protein [Prescottella equi]|uniref:Uncharacterized protein n=1 Tax=Rhodococcus phage REQ2 TaxID=1109713 RepID=G9FH38_9CAUD|nr:hypothetical protein [Prescottella equi]YP_005087057.1 virion structural protein [Rhodococcus phage REQ2]AEV51867.1 hypothetical protein [Rhodococcus phage REQ2]
MTKRLVSFDDEVEGTGLPAVVEERIGEKVLEVGNATYGPDAIAASIANSESSASNAVQQIVDSSLVAFAPEGVVRRVLIGSNLTAARPDYAGPVNWVQSVSLGAVPINIRDGDEITYVEAAPVPWSPAMLPNLSAWYDAQTLQGSADSAVGQWDDLSGHGRHMIQATSGSRPLLRASGLNGHKSVQFDGTDDNMRAAIDSYTGVWTVYVVGQWTAATLSSSQWMLDGLSVDNSGTRLGFYRSSVGFAISRGSNLVSPSADNLVHRHKLVYTGTSTITTDGTQIASGGTGTNMETSSLMVGGRGNLSSWFAGHVGELIYVQGTVSAEDDAKMTTYLRGRWGVS